MTFFARKTCKGPCGRELSLAHSFYRHPTNSDGYLNVCKECHRQNVYANRELKAEYYGKKRREYDAMPHRLAQRRAYQKTLKGKKVHRAACVRYLRWKEIEQRAWSCL